MISEFIDFDVINKKYPNLIYDSSKNIISGNINICKNCNDEIISGHYDLLIHFNKSSIPYVYDVGKKIKRNYEHRYSDGRLCLATDIEQLLFIRNTKSICLWIEKYIESYYISYEYFQKYGIYPFGQYSHGKQGIVEFYEKYFNLDNEKNSLNIIKYIFFNTYRGHNLCPCGNNKKIRDCHGKIIMKCKQDSNYTLLREDFKRWFNEKK
jgi:hypothetical protein